MSKILVISFLFFCHISGIFASGAAEAASAPERGKYLAERGVIIPADEVVIDNYIASVDYKYPIPEEGFGVSLYSGNRQISSAGQDELVQIGIQGAYRDFAELPPLNVAFVIDVSGSMEERDKLEWVKESFRLFIEKVRDIDFVSLVTFNNSANVRFSSTKMKDRETRDKFLGTVMDLRAGGGTNLLAGLELGYKEVLANFRGDYTNRVLFLTDGVGESTGILEMAESYRSIGINVSTIGLGENFDLHLMQDLAVSGGGSTRFISDRDEMEETFSSELDRLIVPVARDLIIEVSPGDGITVNDTWGYQYRRETGKIVYLLPTLHNRDYETILLSTRIGPSEAGIDREIIQVTVTYGTLAGIQKTSGPYVLTVRTVDDRQPVIGYSSGMVLQSGTMLHIAQGLQEIGRLYYNNPSDKGSQKTAIEMTHKLRNEVLNARTRLDDIGFDDEILILDRYMEILGASLTLSKEEMTEYTTDDEMTERKINTDLDSCMRTLLQEVFLSFKPNASEPVAVTGFLYPKNPGSQIVTYLNEMTTVRMSSIPAVTIIDRSRLDEILEEQKLSLSGLVDTSKAIAVGSLLSAKYFITGNILDTPNTVIIFIRVINVETTEVISAAQTILQRNSVINGLLST